MISPELLVSHPYSCPTCRQAFTKWGICRKHFTDPGECGRTHQDLSLYKLQELCRSIAKEPGYASGLHTPHHPEYSPHYTVTVEDMCISVVAVSGQSLGSIRVALGQPLAHCRQHLADTVGVPPSMLQLLHGHTMLKNSADIDAGSHDDTHATEICESSCQSAGLHDRSQLTAVITRTSLVGGQRRHLGIVATHSNSQSSYGVISAKPLLGSILISPWPPVVHWCVGMVVEFETRINESGVIEACNLNWNPVPFMKLSKQPNVMQWRLDQDSIDNLDELLGDLHAHDVNNALVKAIDFGSRAGRIESDVFFLVFVLDRIGLVQEWQNAMPHFSKMLVLLFIAQVLEKKQIHNAYVTMLVEWFVGLAQDLDLDPDRESQYIGDVLNEIRRSSRHWPFEESGMPQMFEAIDQLADRLVTKQQRLGASA